MWCCDYIAPNGRNNISSSFEDVNVQLHALCEVPESSKSDILYLQELSSCTQSVIVLTSKT